jgi:protein-disulfide isomerase
MAMTTLQKPVVQEDHHIGPLTAPLVFVEYGDYECPHCSAADAVVEKLISDFEMSLSYVFRHFPLRTLHPHAELAALAAEAASQQGQFWSMHRLLFQNSQHLSMTKILSLAEELEIDIGQFQDDFQRGDLIDKIDSDVSSGLRSGVQGTPTFYLNGGRVDGPHTFAYLSDLFEEALSKTNRSTQKKFEERPLIF